MLIVQPYEALGICRKKSEGINVIAPVIAVRLSAYKANYKHILKLPTQRQAITLDLSHISFRNTVSWANGQTPENSHFHKNYSSQNPL